jgi:hypothetical protein
MVFKDSAQSIQVSVESEITGATHLSLTQVGKNNNNGVYSYQDFCFQIKILLFFYLKKNMVLQY